MEKLTGLLQERLEKIAELKKQGHVLYGSRFPDRASARDLVENFSPDRSVRLAGRLMAKRGHGKAMFSDLRDESGKIQLYIKKDHIGEAPFLFFKSLDVGDFVGVSGRLFKSKMGEITVEVRSFELLTKALRPLPEKWHGLKDVEGLVRVLNELESPMFLLVCFM